MQEKLRGSTYAKVRAGPQICSKRALQVAASMLLSSLPGDVAQLGERDNRTVEVRGSSPLISTNRTSAYFIPCKSQTSMI